MTPLSLAIVGCGRVAGNHVWAAAKHGFSIRWTCDLVAERAQYLAKAAGSARWTTEIAEIARDPTIDAVAIATDHASHLELAGRMSLCSGVLIEKPLSLPWQNTDSLIRQTSADGIVAAVVSQHRLRPHVRAVKRAVDSGMLGPIEFVRARILAARPDSYYRDSAWRGRRRCEGGSALINQGYHAIDTLIYLFGVPSIEQAKCWTRRPALMDTEETYTARLRFDNGLACEVFGTNAGTVEWDVTLEIFAPQGHLTFDLNHPTDTSSLRRLVIPDLAREADPPPGRSYYGTAHELVYADFASAIRSRRPPAVSLRDALVTQRVISAIYAAAGLQPPDPA